MHNVLLYVLIHLGAINMFIKADFSVSLIILFSFFQHYSFRELNSLAIIVLYWYMQFILCWKKTYVHIHRTYCSTGVNVRSALTELVFV